MLRGILLTCALIFCALPLLYLSAIQPDRESGAVRTIARSRVVRIPFTTLVTPNKDEASEKSIDTLLVSEGGSDELPEGPAGFDVFEDGSFLIADPLRQRLAVFDPNGKFLRALNIGFAADEVTITQRDSIQVRQANTGDIYAVDRTGRPSLKGRTQESETRKARLLSGTTAEVEKRLPAGAPLKITFNKPGLRLLSIESLAADDESNTYVALEATASGQVVDVRKYVRRYSADGKLICEISDIPLDYYVRPVDEFRVRKGILYHLSPARSELQINQWDMR
jgi:hypothetical protein